MPTPSSPRQPQTPLLSFAFAAERFHAFIHVRWLAQFNSLPAMGRLIPGGYEAMRLHVLIGVPAPYLDTVDTSAIAAVFPYGLVSAQGGLEHDVSARQSIWCGRHEATNVSEPA